MSYQKLEDFIQNKMRMSHIYQPAFIKELLLHDGVVTLEEVAKAFLSYDKSQQEYYEYITKTMPSKILKKHGLITQDKKMYSLAEKFNSLTDEERISL